MRAKCRKVKHGFHTFLGKVAELAAAELAIYRNNKIRKKTQSVMYKTNTVDGLGVCRWPRLIPSINLLINIITCCLHKHRTLRSNYSRNVTHIFVPSRLDIRCTYLHDWSGRVTTEWGMSPTLRDADDSGTHGLKDYTDVL